MSNLGICDNFSRHNEIMNQAQSSQATQVGTIIIIIAAITVVTIAIVLYSKQPVNDEEA